MGLAKLYGTSTAFTKMKLFNWNRYETITEGPMAHDYTNVSIKREITEAYNKRHRPVMSPATHPENYDPLFPPEGWSYDPYYEIWIQN